MGNTDWNDPKPHDVLRDGISWTPVWVILGILASAGLLVIVLFSQHVWIFAEKQAVHNSAIIGAAQAAASASVNKNSYNYNQGYEDILTSAWQTLHQDQEALGQEPAGAQAQTKEAVLGDGNTVCYEYYQINQNVIQSPPDITAWVQANCDGPAVSLTSPLRK